MTLESLEVARGHDGFLRGKPEPTLLVAAYRTNGPQPASLVGRLLVRAQLKSAIPCCVDLGEQELHYSARFALTERIALLALAVEENSGKGVEALYAATEAPDQILVYDAPEAEPVPRSLDEWARSEYRAPSAPPVEVLLGGECLAEVEGSDEYIAACAFSVSTQTRSEEVWRLPFIARDRRNDWTLVLRVRVVA